MMTQQEQATNVARRITDYLATGGLFNPELADHEAVSELLRDARDVLLTSVLGTTTGG